MQRDDIIKRIAEINAELEKRKKNDKLAQYNKGRKKHKKQILFHRCKKRNRWVFGGNRSGKTECGAVECIWLLRGNHPYRKRNKKDVFGWAVSLSQQVQRDVAQAKILSYLPKSWIVDITMLSGRKDSPAGGVIDQIKIKNVFGGISTLGFKSCDQGREKFQGSSLDFVWFDEEPPRDIYEECLMRVIFGNNVIYHAKGEFVSPTIVNLVAKNPAVIEMHTGATTQAYVIGDASYYCLNTGIFKPFDGEVHSCILKNGRIFGIDNSNPNKIKWSGEGGIDDWTEDISGAGWTIVQYGYGEILNLVYKEKIVVVREYGLTLFSAYGTPENYKLSYIDRKLPKILKNTAAVAGDRLIFYTEDGLYFYDGNKCEKCNLQLANDIRTPTSVTAAKDKYYLCGLSKGIGRRAILVYNLNLDTVYIMNVDAGALCVGDKAVGYSDYYEYEIVTGGQYFFESAQIDFGTKRQKVLKEVIIEGATGLELEISNGDSVNYVNGVRGKYRPNMRGTSFQITVYVKKQIDSFSAVAEVIDEV